MPTGIYIRTENHRHKISEGIKKHLPSTAFRKGHIPWSKGMHVIANPDTIKKMNEAWRGNHHTEETKRKIGAKNKGKVGWCKGKKGIHLTPKDKYRRGALHPNWKGGITPYKNKIQRTEKYKEWRLMVFGRDDYTCQQCGMRGCYLHAHHILPFASYPEARFDISNGTTLCIECHRKFGCKGGRP